MDSYRKVLKKMLILKNKFLQTLRTGTVWKNNLQATVFLWGKIYKTSNGKMEE